ncbi:hypothetical protein BU15DRAFT_78915 [Melanogaster broomeanus]|nr:hypothetical protein BU15DRAFT_78915 [Melanogaster broomeanus]
MSTQPHTSVISPSSNSKRSQPQKDYSAAWADLHCPAPAPLTASDSKKWYKWGWSSRSFSTASLISTPTASRPLTYSPPHAKGIINQLPLHHKRRASDSHVLAPDQSSSLPTSPVIMYNNYNTSPSAGSSSSGSPSSSAVPLPQPNPSDIRRNGAFHGRSQSKDFEVAFATLASSYGGFGGIVSKPHSA